MNLLPNWLGVGAAFLFLAIAATHLNYLRGTAGQRRAWHGCHVLVAIGMAYMYAPATINPIGISSESWRLVFAAAGLLAAVWALGGVGRTANLLWLLTAVDLGVMIFMWSPGAADSSLMWPVVGYLIGQALLWAVDAYRRLDGGTPIVSWSGLSGGGEATTVVRGRVASGVPGALIGELEMGTSMIAMALGMAYMLVAMRLTM